MTIRKMTTIVASLFTSMLFIVFVPTLSLAEGTNGLGQGKTSFTIAEMDIHIKNEAEKSTLSIDLTKGESFYRELPLATIAEVIEIDNFIVYLARLQGSANALIYEVLKVENGEIFSVAQSEPFERARYTISNKRLNISYPKYKDVQPMTNPEEIVTEIFGVNKGEWIKLQTEKEPFKTDSSKLDKHLFTYFNNPPFSEINDILTEESLKANVSPEIVKAIAYQESGWEQYWTTVPESIKQCKKGERTLPYDGTNVKLGYDCIGVGIMQISDHMYMKEGPAKDAYIERLKTDIRFNIQEGIRILKEKWNYHRSGIIPTVNDNDPMIIENWYFAILAYNGLLPRNNPHTNAFTAYQERVFERLRDYSLIDITPFPTHQLEPYTLDNGQLRFRNDNVTIDGPSHYSSQSLKPGDTTYVTTNGLRLRESPSGDIIGSLNKGTKVTITGNYVGNNSRTSQFVWFPVKTSSGQTGYVASSYLSPTDRYIDVYNLYGTSRYDTSVSIANHGWHWDQPKSIIIGRGDLPIDALTGSVLASSLDAPLLLTRSNSLVASVEREIDRLKPENIYILGGKLAISEEVEEILASKVPKGNVIRISKGGSRYDTAYEVAKLVLSLTNAKEIFITTGDETSSDALAIAPYAGSKGIPILFTRENSLDPNIIKLIKDYSIQKATIIGGSLAISSKVEKELKKHVSTVERVSGKSRFGTSAEIVKRYYGEGQTVNVNRLFITQGFEIADALSVSSLAAKVNGPLLLTRTNAIPSEIKQWLPENILTRPNLYFIGGRLAISDPVRDEFIELIKGF